MSAKRKTSEAKPLLTVHDLQTSFFGEQGEVKAVDHLSFQLREGKSLGIVGESGSGKSVTCLSRRVSCFSTMSTSR